ncbi:MAG: 30S ribosome-binding factor RbfA [Dehalococcoidia bacterium]
MTRRMPKVDDLIQSEVADLLRRHVKHPVLQDTMLSITRVETSPDLQSARVFVSVMDDSANADEIRDALEHTEPFMHRELGRRLHMRRIPHLKFILDRSIAEGDRMATLLREVAATIPPLEDEAEVP